MKQNARTKMHLFDKYQRVVYKNHKGKFFYYFNKLLIEAQ